MTRDSDDKPDRRRARRDFLKKAAAGAAVTPLAVTMMLSAGSRRAYAGPKIPSGIITVTEITL
jgi:hypothetical protein